MAANSSLQCTEAQPWKSASWLQSQKFPTLQYAVPSLISEGYGLLIGAPKIGKSWFSLEMLLAIASGGSCLGGVQVEQKPVCYFALEDGDRRMHSRIEKLMGADVAWPDAFHYITKVDNRKIMGLAEQWYSQNPNSVLVLDTLGKVMPPALSGEGVYERDYRVGGTLKGIVDNVPGSTLLVVHHDNKATGEDWMQSTSGTNGINGAADFTVLLRRQRDATEGALMVTGRDITEGTYSVKFGDCRWSLDGGTFANAAKAWSERRATDGLGGTAASIVSFVDGAGGAVTPAQVSDGVNIDKAMVTTYLGRLADAGRITKVARGKYISVRSVGSVISDDDEIIWETESNTNNTNNTDT